MERSDNRQRFVKIMVAGTFLLNTCLVAVPTFAEELSEKEHFVLMEDTKESDGLEEEEAKEETGVVEEEETVEEETDVVEEEVEEIIEPTFKDVGVNDFGFKAIEYLVSTGLIEGSKNGKFYPKALIKRSEIAKIIALDKGYKAPAKYQIKARDIKLTHWAYNYLAALESKKILVGFDGRIRPNDHMTRAELAVLLNKVYNYGQPQQFYSFTDVKFSHWAYQSINKLATNGITAQRSGTFQANAKVSRAEFALFLARTLDDRFKPFHLKN